MKLEMGLFADGTYGFMAISFARQNTNGMSSGTPHSRVACERNLEIAGGVAKETHKLMHGNVEGETPIAQFLLHMRLIAQFCKHVAIFLKKRVVKNCGAKTMWHLARRLSTRVLVLRERIREPARLLQ
jgi:hypothetical protein